MSMIRINHDPSRRQLATFGAIWLLFFLVWCGISWRRDYPTAITVAFGVAAIAVPLAGLLHLPAIRLVYLAMSYLTLPLGWVVSHVLLAIIYYLVMTPIGLSMRLFGYDPMRRRFDKEAVSYWVERPEQAEKRRYFRQF